MSHIPHHANLAQFKNQAKELLRAFRAGAAQAQQQFHQYFPEPLSPASAKLADAQWVMARRYGFSSWDKACKAIATLPQFRQLVACFEADDLSAARSLIKQHPILLARKDILGRAVRHGSLEMVQAMHALGAREVQDALGYLEYDLKEDIGHYLIEQGATFEAFEVIPGSEALNAHVMQFALSHMASSLNADQGRRTAAMLLSTYSRAPRAKHQCLQMLVEAGVSLPDTAPMALHRGRIDLLAKHLQQDSDLLRRRFKEADFYPPALGIQPRDGLHLTPLDGASLLHMAVEYDEKAILQWLIEQGAEVDIPSAVDEAGFGGHTPLFHTVVSYTPSDDTKARLLLAQGANPVYSANIRKQLRYMGQQHLEKMYEFRGVTPVTYAQQFQVQRWVSKAAVAVIEASK